MKIKILILSFLLLMFASCASTEFIDADNELLTEENSVIVYGYIEDIFKISFIKQSPTFNYELIDCYTSGDCFVLKKPVRSGSEIKLIYHETHKYNWFTQSSSAETYYYSMAGSDIKLSGHNVFYFCLNEEDRVSSKKEREALDYAISKYENTEFKDALYQRLGELKK